MAEARYAGVFSHIPSPLPRSAALLEAYQCTKYMRARAGAKLDALQSCDHFQPLGILLMP